MKAGEKNEDNAKQKVKKLERKKERRKVTIW